jgi:hypothetical protein
MRIRASVASIWGTRRAIAVSAEIVDRHATSDAWRPAAELLVNVYRRLGRADEQRALEARLAATP